VKYFASIASCQCGGGNVAQVRRERGQAFARVGKARQQGARGGFEIVRRARDEADAGAFSQKTLRARQANALAAATDQYMLALQFEFHDCLPHC
jgi:hypothetical protein